MKRTLTSESVTEGHPDKVCDQISDALLDEFIRKDKESHCAIECLLTTGMVLVAGEVTSEAYVDIQKTVRNTLKAIGYDNPEYGMDWQDCAVLNTIHEQSPDIAQGVNRKVKQLQGAGDQGIVYGYACRETAQLMPAPIMFAHKLVQRLADLRKNEAIGYLRPDGKSQVTVEYDRKGNVTRIDNVVIATQHDPDIDIKQLRKDIQDTAIMPVCGDWMDSNTKITINGTGRFVKGGAEADTGLTGRKIIVDTYGGAAHHGGGAFSGKDPSKVDRSGAYAARQVAKSIVENTYASRCEVAISYAIERWVKGNFDLTPYGIIERLDLKKPIYKETACYGHFGRKGFSWEKVKLNELS